MGELQLPFDGKPGGHDVVWPARSGPAIEPRRYERTPELWEQTFELFVGESVLEDLAAHCSRQESLQIVARYQVLRVAAHAGFDLWDAIDPEIERAAAEAWLRTLPNLAERRWLTGVLAAVTAEGDVRQAAISCLAGAAAAALEAGHTQGAFALQRTAYQIARAHAWHAEAARVCRAIARSAAEQSARHSQRLWDRRARVHERKAAA